MQPVLHTSDGRPQLVAQMEEALVRSCVSLGVDPADITAAPVVDKLLRGDIVGWQGAFVPQSRAWYDILFHFTRPGAEHLGQRLTRRNSHDDADLLNAVTWFLGTIQATHRQLFETGGPGVNAASTTLFSPPVVAFHPDWLAEAGTADEAHVVKFPHVIIVCDFHASPGVAKVKPMAGVEPGDVLNEAVSARGQSRRIPLANRGIVLNPERIAKLALELEQNQTVWVVEPSLLTRRLHRN